MTDPILTLYANGASIRQTAARLQCSPKVVRRTVRDAGILRTKSEGCFLRHNSVTTTKGGELVLKLSWVTIRSPYVVMPFYPGSK